MMSHPRLKLVTIIAEDDIEDLLVDELKSLGARGYTVCPVRGEGLHGPRTSGWEGENIRVETIVEPALAEAIAARLAAEYFPRCAMVVYLSDVEVLRAEHFTGG
ncbi:MAG: hypothetical protein N2322_01020 [Terrimicrobiaceae bacterium]|nr:hypothetical protein [Terrimicrobiaceae bacterium]